MKREADLRFNGRDKDIGGLSELGFCHKDAIMDPLGQSLRRAARAQQPNHDLPTPEVPERFCEIIQTTLEIGVWMQITHTRSGAVLGPRCWSAGDSFQIRDSGQIVSYTLEAVYGWRAVLGPTWRQSTSGGDGGAVVEVVPRGSNGREQLIEVHGPHDGVDVDGLRCAVQHLPRAQGRGACENTRRLDEGKRQGREQGREQGQEQG